MTADEIAQHLQRRHEFLAAERILDQAQYIANLECEIETLTDKIQELEKDLRDLQRALQSKASFADIKENYA